MTSGQRMPYTEDQCETFGRKGTYDPSAYPGTPGAPVQLAYNQFNTATRQEKTAGGMPAPQFNDDGANEEPSSCGRFCPCLIPLCFCCDRFWTKKKKLIAAAIAVAILLLLIIILPIVLTRGDSEPNKDTSAQTGSSSASPLDGFGLGNLTDLFNGTELLANSTLLGDLDDDDATDNSTLPGPSIRPYPVFSPSRAPPPAIQPYTPFLNPDNLPSTTESVTSTEDGLLRSVAELVSCDAYPGFTCASDGLVLNAKKRCDAINDCADATDEQGCQDCLTAVHCPLEPSPSTVKHCLRGHVLCDGSLHGCATNIHDSALYCGRSCIADEEYRCAGLGGASTNSTVCIVLDWLCDGDEQCPLGDDESVCHSATDCQRGAVWCASLSKCLPQWQVCDGKVDCPAQFNSPATPTDEDNCDCSSCHGDSVVCSVPSGRCVHNSRVCDGVSDCDDAADELDC
jgi:hypothetical protein